MKAPVAAPAAWYSLKIVRRGTTPRTTSNREAPGKSRIPSGVVDDGGLARLGDPTRDPLADLHAERRDVVRLFAQGQLEGQLLLLLVDHEHRPGLGRDELLDLAHDQLDDLARLEDRVRGLDDIGQDREPLGRGPENPLPPELLEAKFLNCAARALPIEQAETLLAMLLAVDAVHDMRRVTEAMLLVPALAAD